MPTYEYACKKCSETLEVVQSFSDEPLKVCPNCQGELRKVFSAPGISFKGSGFYKNDSRGPSQPSTSSSESSSPSDAGKNSTSESGSSPTSDTKSTDSSSTKASSSSSSSSSDSTS